MCMSCGCGEPNEAHGSTDNITMDTIQRAADAAGISTSQVAENIRSSASAA